MKRFISTGIFLSLSVAAMAQGKWNVGAVAGWGISHISETINTADPVAVQYSRYKFKIKGNGPVAGLSAGYSFQHQKNIFELNIAGYRDMYSSKNQGYKEDILSNYPIVSKNVLKRDYTWELAGKIGRSVTKDVQVYGKLGVLKSAFQEQYADTADDVKASTRGWGGLLGVGIQKEFNTINVGIEYNYSYYESTGTKLHYATYVTNTSKIRPQYHNVFVRISKAF